MHIREFTATATRHQNLLADLIRAFQHYDTATATTSHSGAHKTSRPTTQDNDIVIIHGGNITGQRTSELSRVTHPVNGLARTHSH
jgi:hypothetical protein